MVTITVAVLLAIIIIVVRLRRRTHSRTRLDEKMTVVICLTFGVLIAPTDTRRTGKGSPHFRPHRRVPRVPWR
ncbi:hypothetical protein [Streptomyces indiaensis]|uniref:hypothetical protein n=1 Tax=Streptomyces indiaensis TaxID=284033 RepID=UPI001F301199|nr:hypothetical protein [Streptomyces indiaensis]MCF1646020.1 hypothetical protein [Streptomyces indiaensis]